MKKTITAAACGTLFFTAALFAVLFTVMELAQISANYDYIEEAEDYFLIGIFIVIVALTGFFVSYFSDKYRFPAVTVSILLPLIIFYFYQKFTVCFAAILLSAALVFAIIAALKKNGSISKFDLRALKSVETVKFIWALLVIGSILLFLLSVLLEYRGECGTGRPDGFGESVVFLAGLAVIYFFNRVNGPMYIAICMGSFVATVLLIFFSQSFIFTSPVIFIAAPFLYGNIPAKNLARWVFIVYIGAFLSLFAWAALDTFDGSIVSSFNLIICYVVIFFVTFMAAKLVKYWRLFVAPAIVIFGYLASSDVILQLSVCMVALLAAFTVEYLESKKVKSETDDTDHEVLYYNWKSGWKFGKKENDDSEIK